MVDIRLEVVGFRFLTKDSHLSISLFVFWLGVKVECRNHKLVSIPLPFGLSTLDIMTLRLPKLPS